MQNKVFADFKPGAALGLIFDVDELLFDNRAEIYSAYESLLTSRAITPEKGDTFPGKDLFETIENIKNKYGLKETLDELVQERRAVYIEKLRRTQSGPCKGVKELFEFIDDVRTTRDIRVAYTTSSERAFTEIILKKIFKDIGMNKYMSDPDAFFFKDRQTVVSTCWQEGLKKKPDPIMYKMTMEKMKLTPAQCIAFEDSLSGFKSAYTAGVNKVVVIPNSRSRKHFEQYEFEKGHERRICRFESLTDFVSELRDFLTPIGNK